MLSKEDKEYLLSAHPLLKLSEDEKMIEGSIGFTAVYDSNKQNDSFTIIGAGDTGVYTGDLLSGTFNIRIEFDSFPRLVILDKLPKEARRHFYTDCDELVGCVCGLVEQMRFMQNFNLKDYIELKVVPFLFGQLYFDNIKAIWPFPAYAHNTLGLLESYYLGDGTEFRDAFLDRLRLQKSDWVTLEPVLYGKQKPRGHMRCLCTRGDFIRRCHQEAWEGLKKLYSDIHATP